MLILPMYTEQEREEMKPYLDQLIQWLDKNEHLKDTEEYKLKYSEAEGVYETIYDL
tara:strand:- start:14326 stop:14493 length:168 start_codon:yes stop_codon:yes gene_type:complete